MDQTMVRGGLAAFALITCVASTPALAETVKFKADLAGTNEIPPTTSPGKGTLEATFDSATKQLTYTVNYSGLTGRYHPRRADPALHRHGCLMSEEEDA